MTHDPQITSAEKPMMALRWMGRVIGVAGSALYLFGFGAEAAGGYPPGGTLTAATVGFTLFSVALVASIISIWWDWLGGAILVAVGVTFIGVFLFGVFPYADVLASLNIAVPFLLAGALLLFARKRTRRHVLA